MGSRLLSRPPSSPQEAALSKAGPELYENIFKHYTYKQWDKCVRPARIHRTISRVL